MSYATPTTTAENVGSPALLNILANLTEDSRLQVRAAFFNICAKRPTIIQSQAYWECASANDLIARYGSDVDPLGLIQYADLFATRIVFYGLMYVDSPTTVESSQPLFVPVEITDNVHSLGSLVLCLGSFIALATFPGWQTSISDDGSEIEIKRFPSRLVLIAIVWALGLAFALGFVSILWIHIGAVAAAESIKANYRHFVDANVGPAAMAVGWVAVTLVAIAFLGVLIMKLSIELLDELTEEDE